MRKRLYWQRKAGVVVIAIDAQANGPMTLLLVLKTMMLAMAGKRLGEALGGKGEWQF